MSFHYEAHTVYEVNNAFTCEMPFFLSSFSTNSPFASRTLHQTCRAANCPKKSRDHLNAKQMSCSPWILWTVQETETPATLMDDGGEFKLYITTWNKVLELRRAMFWMEVVTFPMYHFTCCIDFMGKSF